MRCGSGVTPGGKTTALALANSNSAISASSARQTTGALWAPLASSSTSAAASKAGDQLEPQFARRAPAGPGETRVARQLLAVEPQDREAVAGDQRDARLRRRLDLGEQRARARRADVAPPSPG